MSNEEITEYVVGFLFDPDYRWVALIRKNRPAWQAGRLNGVGGHVEPGETPDDAMEREFEEETGAKVTGWQKFVLMDFPGARIHFYKLRSQWPIINSLTTTTDEPVDVYNLDLLADGEYAIIPNLSWLLPLATYTADEYDVLHVRAKLAVAVLP